MDFELFGLRPVRPSKGLAPPDRELSPVADCSAKACAEEHSVASLAPDVPMTVLSPLSSADIQALNRGVFTQPRNGMRLPITPSPFQEQEPTMTPRQKRPRSERESLSSRSSSCSSYSLQSCSSETSSSCSSDSDGGTGMYLDAGEYVSPLDKRSRSQRQRKCPTEKGDFDAEAGENSVSPSADGHRADCPSPASPVTFHSAISMAPTGAVAAKALFWCLDIEHKDAQDLSKLLSVQQAKILFPTLKLQQHPHCSMTFAKNYNNTHITPFERAHVQLQSTSILMLQHRYLVVVFKCLDASLKLLLSEWIPLFALIGTTANTRPMCFREAKDALMRYQRRRESFGDLPWAESDTIRWGTNDVVIEAVVVKHLKDR